MKISLPGRTWYWLSTLLRRDVHGHPQERFHPTSNGRSTVRPQGVLKGLQLSVHDDVLTAHESYLLT